MVNPLNDFAYTYIYENNKKLLASCYLTRSYISTIVLEAGLEPAQPLLAKGF